MKKEPVITVAALVAIAGSIIGVLVAFGVPVTEEQRDAIERLLLSVGPLVLLAVAALVARRAVTPNAKIAAYDTGTEIVAGPASKVADGVRVAVHPDEPDETL